LLIICGYFQVRQVREGDVLRQKAYMLFYVRDRVMSPIKQKDIGAANLSNTKMIPEKIECVDCTTLNGLVEPPMKVPSLSGEDTKLQENVDVGQPSTSNIRNSLQNPCSITRNNTEVTEASILQNNVSAYVQKTPFEDQCPNAHNKI
jgi:ubiquitin carboxyl-terminal hydrolase 36/42